MAIANNKVVSLQYSVLDDEGQIIDSSEGGNPLVILIGANNVVPGLEEALIGKTTGDEVKAVVTPDKAYGEYHEEGVQQVPRAAFEGVDVLEPGMAFTAQTENGPTNLIIIEVVDDLVTIDSNHPLAGQTLTFDVVVEEVRDATEEELQHGHAHGADCSH